MANEAATYSSETVQLVVKKQTDISTYLLPVYTTDMNIKFYDVSDVKRDYGHTGGGNYADGTSFVGESVSGKKPKGIDAVTKLRWSGTLATAPKDWILFEAAGCRVDTSGLAAKVVWEGMPTCNALSIDRYIWRSCPTKQAQIDKIASAVANFTISFDGVGSELMVNWNFQGKDAGEAAYTGAFALPSGIDTVLKGEQLLGATLTHAGYVYRIYSGTYTHNANPQEVPNSNDTTNGVKTGIDHYKIGGKVNATLEVEAVRVMLADSNPYASVRNNEVASTTVLDLEHLTMTFTGTQMIDAQAGTQNETPTEKFTFMTKGWEIVQKA